MTRRVSFWVPIALAGLNLSGCSIPLPAASRTAAQRAPQHGTSASRSPRSTSNRNNGVPSPWNAWAQALSRYAQGGTTTAKPAPHISAPHVSSMRDAAPETVLNETVLSLARDHPAWKLADALERRLALNSAMAAGIPSGASALANNAASSRFQSATFGGLDKDTDAFNASELALTHGAPASEPQSTWSSFHNAHSVLPGVDFALPRQLQVAAMPDWEQAARARQEIAFARFLQATRTQQFELRRARENDLGAALADDVEAARGVRFAFGDPLLPSDPIQLEMTNLRLRLLENARLTQSEKQRARARLALLEARWRQNLQNGQNANRNEFLELRDAEPLRVRNEGEARIAAALAQIRDEDAARRGATQAALKQRLEADFNRQDATLAVVLPRVSRPAFSDLTDKNGRVQLRTVHSRRRTNKTFAPASSSNGQSSDNRQATRALNFPTHLPPFKNGNNAPTISVQSSQSLIEAQIRALRQRALLESARWARLTTRSTPRSSAAH